ncbi:glycosyltransferase family 4 protein [Patescibacteria group bacterium]|nr:glycosyltransferase family 4 protein [Candidatus Falkowbacteria bacterium]MBU3906004.1 glycosyltransferase family 4 protein [Patescibacteria group bacterium]MBU4026293.1 glycosyltransferase family 4 protein [Patescibacteria group bacterium]MBU4073180.1 glycosyltransferase family 4 protein [Patescibacteria group bacterium]MBU4102692.1 glycosyltransferase family 4 protein [Patescibacteria group bacterium]
MKILIFSTAYFPFVGGAEVAVKEISDRINDIEFSMITARMDKKLAGFEKVGNVDVHRVGIGWPTIDKFLLPFFGFLKALKLHKKNDYNIAWPIMASHASIAAAFLKIFKPKIKLLLTLQEGDEEEYLKRYAFGSEILYKFFIQPWHLLVFKKADYAAAISNDLKQRALRGGVKSKIEVVPNGVDAEKFEIRNLKFEIRNLRKELGVKESEKVIITTSRLVKKNGIDDLIKAINELGIRNYELAIKLLICGIGEDEKKLKDLAKDLKIENKVMFLGQVDHKDLPKYLWISDVFCRPSLSEGLGNSFLEAMAADLPVVATPVGGIPDFLKDGETGWFCKVKDPKSIAEKIKYILDEKNKEEVERVVENAKKMVEEKYNWDKIAVKFKEIFNNLWIPDDLIIK